MKKHSLHILLISFIFCACGSSPIPVPKPRLYPKITFPDRNNKTVDLDFCAFKFDFPDYANAVQDSFYFEEEILDRCWFDLIIPSLNGRMHCSYIPIKNKTHFHEMVEDAFELVIKHNIKANSRDETLIEFPSKEVYGIQFEMDGPVASHYQFFLTDSVKHFLRGSLYFEAQVDQDSIAPVVDFVKEDIEQMISSFEWK